MKKKLLFTLIVIISMLVTNLKAQWVQVNSIYYNNVQCLATMPNLSGGSDLFAGTFQNGVYVSGNNGTTWTPANTGLNNNINCLLVTGTNLFAGTGGGVFLSTNHGLNWTSVSTGITTTIVTALAVIGNNLFAGTAGGGVFLSTNNGTSWTAANNGLTDNYIYSLATGSNGSGGTNIYAGTHNSGVYKSANNGTNWTQINNGLPLNGSDVYVSALATVPNGTGGTNLFTGSGNGGVYLSTDYGSNWNASGLSGEGILSFTLIGSDLYAGCNSGGVYLSSNNGTSWIPASNGIGTAAVLSLASFPYGVGGNNLLAGTSHGIFVSTNNGTSWTMQNSGLSNLFVRSLTTAPDGTGGTNIFVGTGGNGMFILTMEDTLTEINNGFVTRNFNIWSLASRTTITDTTYIFAGCFDGWVYRTVDNGANWTKSTMDLSSDVKGLVVSDTNLFAGASGHGVYVSTDNGTNWTDLSTGLTNTQITSLILHGTNLFAGTHAGVFRSSNYGTNWTEVNTGLTNTWIEKLAENGTYLFAGGWGVFRSTDNGDNWTKACTGFSPYIKGLYANGTNLFAGANGDGAYLSTNNGSSWTEVNTGLPDGISGLCFATRQDSSGVTILYMGTELGLWSRPLSQVTGLDEHRSSQNGMLDLLQNYPNPFQTATTIKYKVKEPGFVSLKIFDIMGIEVATLVNEQKPAGNYSIEWNATGLASNIYFCKLQTGYTSDIMKMIKFK